MKKLLTRLFNSLKPAMCGPGTKAARCNSRLQAKPARCARGKAKVGQCRRSRSA